MGVIQRAPCHHTSKENWIEIFVTFSEDYMCFRMNGKKNLHKTIGIHGFSLMLFVRI